MPVFFLYNDKDQVGTVTVRDVADSNHPTLIIPGGVAGNPASFALPPETTSLSLSATTFADGTGRAAWTATNAVNQLATPVQDGVTYNLSDGTEK